MATIYLKASGSATPPYDTWAKAATNLATAVGAMNVSGGDTLYIDKDYAESASSFNITVPGSLTAPSIIISGTPDTPTGISAMTKGATFTCTTNAGSYWVGFFYAYGLKFVTNSSSTTEMRINNSQASGFFENCEFTIGSTAGGSGTHQLKIGATAATAYSHTILKDCTIRYSSSNSATRMALEGRVEFIGGGMASDTSSTPTRVFAVGAGNDGTYISFTGFDFSYVPNTAQLIYSNAVAGNVVRLERCKMPSGWSPDTGFSSVSVPMSVEWDMVNCSGTSGENWKTYRARGVGTGETSTAHVRSGGASDGTTAYAYKMVSNTSASVATPMYTPWFSKWNETTGNAMTVAAEILHDSATDLSNGNCWIEVDALSTADYPIGTVVSGRAAPLGSGYINHDSSSETWSNTGSMTNPNKQTITSASFTPNVKGSIRWRIGLAATSKTVYVDPEATIA